MPKRERPGIRGNVAAVQVLHPLGVVPAEERVLVRDFVGDDLRLAGVVDYVGLAPVESGLVFGQRREHIYGDVRGRFVYGG